MCICACVCVYLCVRACVCMRACVCVMHINWMLGLLRAHHCCVGARGGWLLLLLQKLLLECRDFGGGRRGRGGRGLPLAVPVAALCKVLAVFWGKGLAPPCETAVVLLQVCPPSRAAC